MNPPASQFKFKPNNSNTKLQVAHLIKLHTKSQSVHESTLDLSHFNIPDNSGTLISNMITHKPAQAIHPGRPN